MTSEDVTFRQSRHPVFVAENFFFIYFNSNLHQDKELVSRWCDSFPSSIHTFDEVDSCIDFLTDASNHVSLILCDAQCETLFPLIHEIPQLIRIYIAHERTTEHEDWMKTWKKVQIVPNDTALMFNQLHRHFRHANESSVPISVARSYSTTNPNEVDPSFMYSQLLKEAILQLKHNEKAKSQFVEFCRENPSRLMASAAKISEFERDYTSTSAIWWYTKEPVIYATLNHALRMQDIEVIMTMDFYIQDLHREIQNLHSNVPQNTTMTRYRGQGMYSAEFERIKNGEGGFLSFNSFLSTSSDQLVSYIFADSARQESDLIGIFFIMEIDPSIASVPFASLDGLSHYSEQETLFSMNTIFRIGKVESIDDRLWQVSLTLTNDTDPQLTELTEHIRNVNEKSGPIGQLGSLMMSMGKYDQAETYYRILLKNCVADNDYEELADMHNQMGHLSMLKDDLTRTTYHWSTCFNIASKHLSSNHPSFPSIHNNLAVLFKRQNKLELALQSLQCSLDMTLRASPCNELNIAIVYINIGDVLKLQCEYHQALKNYDFSLAWLDKGIPQLHPGRIKLYEAVASVHSRMGDKSKALSYYQKALDIQKRSLPPNHPSIAVNHDNIAYVLECLNRFEEAAKHIRRAADINQCPSGSIQPNVEDLLIRFSQFQEKPSNNTSNA